MKIITLPIKKKWFEMILSGEKKEEYREIKSYYESRFKNAGEKFIAKFINGYSSESPQFDALVEISTGFGREEWGAESGKKYYVLKIIEINKNGKGGEK